MTFSIAWVVLAATVSVLAMLRRAGTADHRSGGRARQSGNILVVLAVVYSVVLIAGFVYIGWHSGLGWIK